jgi:long-chain acyl-CoA synthetase
MQLFSKFKDHKYKIALMDESGNQLTYSQILILLSKFKKKIKINTLILILAKNNISSLLFYVICILNKNKIILIDEKTDKKNVNEILNLYKPKYIVCNSKFANKKNFNKSKFQYFESSIFESTFKNTRINPNLQLLIPTSGSSGSSKMVQLSKKNILSNTKSILKYLKITTKDRAVTNMPFNYSYMLSIINTHLEKGASIYVSQKTILEKDFWNEFQIKKITSFNGVPYIWQMLKRIGLKKIFTNNLKYITQAGGNLDKYLTKDIYKICKLKKKDMYIMYGQTEASPRLSYIKNEDIIKNLGSIGKPIDGVKMWIENNNSEKILKPNQLGNIHASGKNIMIGYSNSLKDLKSKKKSIKKINTGDIGYFDKKGFFYITGRSSRIAKIYGNRIDLEDLEIKLKKQKINIICSSNNNRLFVFYLKNLNKKNLENKIYNILKLNTVSIEMIKIKKIPLTMNKKINYKKLMELI